MEEEGEPKDPVVEAALDQGLGTRKRGLGGLLTDFSTRQDANHDDEQDYCCDYDDIHACPSILRQWWPECENNIGIPGYRERAAILPYISCLLL